MNIRAGLGKHILQTHNTKILWRFNGGFEPLNLHWVRNDPDASNIYRTLTSLSPFPGGYCSDVSLGLRQRRFGLVTVWRVFFINTAVDWLLNILVTTRKKCQLCSHYNCHCTASVPTCSCLDETQNPVSDVMQKCSTLKTQHNTHVCLNVITELNCMYNRPAKNNTIATTITMETRRRRRHSNHQQFKQLTHQSVSSCQSVFCRC